jgi:hypothetical protein
MKRAILITGCQRSGTNLVNLILDSHPQIIGLDEVRLFHWEVVKPMMIAEEPRAVTAEEMVALMTVDDRIAAHLADPQHPPYVAFQLPPYAAKIAALKAVLPELQILWCLRDPRDVVTSMLQLDVPFTKAESVPWAVHPAAEYEIDQALRLLSQQVRQALSSHLATYQRIQQKSPPVRTRQEAVFMGALCWRLKNELLLVYERAQIPYLLVRYEQLISDPKPAIEKMLRDLDVPWHADVLRHHELHTGLVSGETDSARAIDATNAGKWQAVLSAEELEVVQEVTSGLALRMGYPL